MGISPGDNEIHRRARVDCGKPTVMPLASLKQFYLLNCHVDDFYASYLWSSIEY